MALLDQLRTMEQQVERRLRELEPLVTEYHELQKVAQRLGISAPDGKSTAARGRRSRATATTRAAAGSPATAPKSQRSRARRASRQRTGRGRNAAAPGSRQQDVLRLVNERPGISVPELGRELGVDPTGLYQIVRRLESRGMIRKDGRQLQPVPSEPETSGAEVAGGATS